MSTCATAITASRCLPTSQRQHDIIDYDKLPKPQWLKSLDK
jgi:hypothetical protein